MEGLLGVTYLLTGGALVFIGVLLGGGMAKAMMTKEEKSE